MRADARANREALLAAARQLYATRGGSVPFSLIAAEAGVGIGTLYRHFPTPEDLVAGLIVQTRDRIVEICRRRRAQLAEDPEGAWAGFVGDLADLELGALLPSLVDGREVEELPLRIDTVRSTILTEVGTILDLAKDAGLVRAEVSPLQFHAGIGALTRPLPAAVASQLPDLGAWLVEIYLAGLRPNPDD